MLLLMTVEEAVNLYDDEAPQSMTFQEFVNKMGIVFTDKMSYSLDDLNEKLELQQLQQQQQGAR